MHCMIAHLVAYIHIHMHFIMHQSSVSCGPAYLLKRASSKVPLSMYLRSPSRNKQASPHARTGEFDSAACPDLINYYSLLAHALFGWEEWIVNFRSFPIAWDFSSLCRSLA